MLNLLTGSLMPMLRFTQTPMKILDKVFGIAATSETKEYVCASVTFGTDDAFISAVDLD